MTYYGLSLSSSNLNGDIYFNCFFSAAIDIVVYVSIWLLVERWPRPTLMFRTTMFSGVILLTLMLIPEGQPSCDVTRDLPMSCLVLRFVCLRIYGHVASVHPGRKDRCHLWFLLHPHVYD